MKSSPCPSRRHILGGAVAVGVGVPILAACGSGSASAPALDAGAVLARTSDIEVGGGLILADAGVVITQPSEGVFKAFSATCTHQACTVTAISETINCACHGSKFALADGSVEAGPAPEPLPEIPITVNGEEITAA